MVRRPSSGHTSVSMPGFLDRGVPRPITVSDESTTFSPEGVPIAATFLHHRHGVPDWAAESTTPWPSARSELDHHIVSIDLGAIGLDRHRARSTEHGTRADIESRLVKRTLDATVFEIAIR